MSTSPLSPSVAAHLPTSMLVDGRWQPSSTGATFEVGDPATEESLFDVADGSPDDGLRALDAAHEHAEVWRRASPRTRSDVLRDVFDA